MADPVGTDQDALETRIAAAYSEIARKRNEALWLKLFVVIAWAVIVVCVYLLVTAAPDQVWRRVLTGTGVLCALIFLVVFAHFLLDISREIHIVRDNLERHKFESEMMDYEASLAQRRAEKMFRINEQLLRRHYDQNLSQGKWVFWTGIALVAFGIVVVVGTVYAVGWASGQTQAQIVIGAVGAVGAILINYVVTTNLFPPTGDCPVDRIVVC